MPDGKRLSDYSVGPNSKLNLVVKPLEKVLLEESAARRLAEAPPPPAPAWQLVSKVLARHFSAADAARVLDQLQRVSKAAQDIHPQPGCAHPLPQGTPDWHPLNPAFSPQDYERSLNRLTLDDIERLAGRFLHPEVTEAVEKGFSK